MKGKIWGSRGSIASPGKDTKRYGGNTSCIELRPPGCDVVILDAGTGIRELGVRLVREGAERMFLLLTHLHVDHLEGLGMFEPIWRSQTELHIWGPSSPVASLEQRIAMYFSPPLFPVHLSEVPATIEYHDASESEWQIDGARFSSNAIIHPGPTVGYRIESRGRSLAYLTDHEPALGADLDRDPSEWISGFAIAHGADLLIHDCQFTPSEYEHRVGWGHSTTEAGRAVRREDRGRPAAPVPSRSDALRRTARPDARGRRRPLGRRWRSVHRCGGGRRDRRLIPIGDAEGDSKEVYLHLAKHYEGVRQGASSVPLIGRSDRSQVPASSRTLCGRMPKLRRQPWSSSCSALLTASCTGGDRATTRVPVPHHRKRGCR